MCVHISCHEQANIFLGLYKNLRYHNWTPSFHPENSFWVWWSETQFFNTFFLTKASLFGVSLAHIFLKNEWPRTCAQRGGAGTEIEVFQRFLSLTKFPKVSQMTKLHFFTANTQVFDPPNRLTVFILFFCWLKYLNFYYGIPLPLKQSDKFCFDFYFFCKQFFCLIHNLDEKYNFVLKLCVDRKCNCGNWLPTFSQVWLPCSYLSHRISRPTNQQWWFPMLKGLIFDLFLDFVNKNEILFKFFLRRLWWSFEQIKRIFWDPFPFKKHCPPLYFFSLTRFQYSF